jgi:hypothetical protein
VIWWMAIWWAAFWHMKRDLREDIPLHGDAYKRALWRQDEIEGIVFEDGSGAPDRQSR